MACAYLFGAGQLLEANYFDKEDELPHPIRSIRQSSYGFVLDLVVALSMFKNMLNVLKKDLNKEY